MAVNSRRFQLDGTTVTTCHTIHRTQCKHTIHVHNWDIYGIFHGCHVNPWSNQGIKSCCQQAKTVTLQKKFQLPTWNITFIILRLFSSCLLLYALHRFWLGLLRYKENVNELFKMQYKFQPILNYFYFQRTYFLQVIILRSHAKRGRDVLRVDILLL